MACNAVSVVKAAVTNEQLLGLLTPDLVCQIVKAALADQRYQAEPRVAGASVVAGWSYGNRLTVTGGQVRVEGYDRGEAQRITDAVSAALALAGDAMLASRIAATIARVAKKRPVVRQVEVEESGQVTQANLFTVRIGG